jgi:hypothetical protein
MTDRSTSSTSSTSSTDAPPEARPGLLAANTSGSLPSIVFLHTSADDEPAQFDALGPAVGPAQPLYAIEPPDAATLARFDHVADWVAYERRRLDELPVRPPYRLAGWSFASWPSSWFAASRNRRSTPATAPSGFRT